MKKFLTILITLAVAGSSCKKDYLNLTNNPNVPSAATPNLLLSAALKTTADIVNGPGYVMYAAWVGYLSQSTNYQPFVTLEQYQFTTSTYDVWTPNYLNLSNYKALALSTPEPNYQAISKIMTAYDYEALVDNYNNVPYNTALQGTNVLNPTYTSGQAIYLDLMKQLDAAIVLIQNAPASALNPAAADIMFNGKMNNWIKFANTLKLRLCLRESTNPSLAADFATLTAAVKATQSLGYLDGTIAATVNPGYLNSDANGGQQSPLWRNYGTTQSGSAQTDNAQYQANTFAANFFGSNNDPRLTRVYSPSSTAGAAGATNLVAGSAVNVYNGVAVVSTSFGDAQPPKGTVNGSNNVGLSPSKIGPGLLKSATQNAVIMSSAEALFLQSEAAARGVISGDPVALYNAGITASFVDEGLTAAQATSYYTQAAIAYPAAGSLETQVQAIITQKWAALDVFGAFEAFNEERRTGYPNVPTSIYPGANAPNQVTRIFYPFVEYQTNAASVAAQGTLDKFTSKIFWAK